MALTISNNIASLNAQNSLERTNGSLAKSLERLSTGLKVNRGADGPAALVISEQQRAQISGLRTAIDNTNKAVSLVQTGEGALNEVNKLLNKVRTLAVDSANSGVNDATSQAANQAEISNILTTIDRISSTTKFGSKNLFDGSAGVSGGTDSANVTFLKAGTETVAGTYAVNVSTAAEKANTDAAALQAGALAADENLNVNGVQIKLTAGLSQSQVIDKINEYSNQTGVKADANGTGGRTRLISNDYGSSASITAISDQVAGATSSGIGTTALTDTGVNVAGTINGVAATGSGNVLTASSGAAKGLSVSFAAASATSASSVSGAQGNTTVVNNSLSFQVGANSGETVKVSFDKISSGNVGVGASNVFAKLSDINTSNGGEALKVIDKAISDVSELRSRLGAFQTNTLESTANNLRTTLENTTSAESVIRDTDFASEIANFTKFQTQLQAGTTVLGNANQLTQLVAGLLR
jgi:flagellin